MIKKYFELFTNPKKHFKENKKKDFRYNLLFFAVPYFSLAILYDVIIRFQNVIRISYVEALITIFAYSLTALIFPFLFGGLTHLGSILLGSKKTFQDTFKVSTLAITNVLPYFLLGILFHLASYVLSWWLLALPMQTIMSVLGTLAFIHSFFTLLTGFRIEHKFTVALAVFASIIPLILIFMIFFVLGNVVL